MYVAYLMVVIDSRRWDHESKSLSLVTRKKINVGHESCGSESRTDFYERREKWKLGMMLFLRYEIKILN